MLAVCIKLPCVATLQGACTRLGMIQGKPEWEALFLPYLNLHAWSNNYYLALHNEICKLLVQLLNILETNVRASIHTYIRLYKGASDIKVSSFLLQCFFCLAVSFNQWVKCHLNPFTISVVVSKSSYCNMHNYTLSLATIYFKNIKYPISLSSATSCWKTKKSLPF